METWRQFETFILSLKSVFSEGRGLTKNKINRNKQKIHLLSFPLQFLREKSTAYNLTQKGFIKTIIFTGPTSI